jgi:hypothetical protein
MAKNGKSLRKPFFIPNDHRETLKFALDLIEQCRSTSSNRAAICRLVNQIITTGKNDGTKSLINMLNNHIERTSSHIYSPPELRFTIDFENDYPTEVLERGKVVGRSVTRGWERNNTDMVFGQGVTESLKYGAALLKQWPQIDGPDQNPSYNCRVVMPWQFGVYREDENDINKQHALCESTMLTLPEVWRRIYHLPDAENIFNRVRQNSSKGQSSDEAANSPIHQVLISSQINTTLGATARPGGVVQMDPNLGGAALGPQVQTDMVRHHELWVQDETDYVTIQLIEPDILIAPLYKKTNLLIPGDTGSCLHPYTLIQPNVTQGYFWGNTEVMDLIEPQQLLSMWASDAKRLFGVQVDKILAFFGYDGLNDEKYDEMRSSGYFNGPQGATVTDLTPKFPSETLPLLKFLMEVINLIGGFPDIMQGRGESGVRTGVHADTLIKTGSPRLRDKSLLVERQCAQAGDLYLSLREAKEARTYWTDGSNIEKMKATSFKLTDLPDDRRVAVDSHSSSPIFADDHAQLTAFGVKVGALDGEDVIDDLPFPNKDVKKHKLRNRQLQQAKMIESLKTEHPDIYEKLMAKKLTGGSHH